MKFSASKRCAAWAAGIALLVAGCETVPMEPSADYLPDMIVATDHAQFFKLGPQQAGGADFSLRAGEAVMLQRKEFGYSRVQLENDLVGYMANEDIEPLPPEAKPKPGKRKSGSRSRSGGGEAAVYEDDSADIPVMDPNLDILPEDIPLEPLPDLLPEPAPQIPAAPAPAPEPTPIRESIPAPAPDTAPVSTST